MICCLLIKQQIIFSIKLKEGLMNILLIYPEYEDTFWNFKNILRVFIILTIGKVKSEYVS